MILPKEGDEILLGHVGNPGSVPNGHKALGVGFVDAPVSGGEPKAITGELAIMCARIFRLGGTIKVNHKDIKNVLATAREIDAPVPFTAQLFEMLVGVQVKSEETL